MADKKGLMKQTFPFALIALVWLTACANLERNTYRTLGSLAVTVDGAMNGWGDYVRNGHGNIAQHTAVKQAYGNYQGAMRVAQTAVTAYRLNPDERELSKALAVASASAGDLTRLIYSLINPTKPESPQ